jgi:hypothetical protein
MPYPQIVFLQFPPWVLLAEMSGRWTSPWSDTYSPIFVRPIRGPQQVRNARTRSRGQSLGLCLRTRTMCGSKVSTSAHLRLKISNFYIKVALYSCTLCGKQSISYRPNVYVALTLYLCLREHRCSGWQRSDGLGSSSCGPDPCPLYLQVVH